MDNEKELLSRIAQGDEQAFKQLFHAYGPLMRSVIIQIIKQEEPVADLIQDVFLRIWVHRDTLPSIENPRSWILQIVYRHSFNWLRQQRVQHRAVSNLTTHQPVPKDTDIESMLFFADTSRLVHQAISNLGEQSRKIYLLSRDQGMKMPEIAQLLGISLQTVKNTLSRSLKVIRDYLEAHGRSLPVLLLWFWPV